MYRNLYLSKDENEFVAEHGEGYVRELIQAAMLSDGKSIAISRETPVREDRPTCRECKGNLDRMGRCSNKKCRRFLK